MAYNNRVIFNNPRESENGNENTGMGGTYGGQTQQATGSVHFEEIIDMLYRRKWIIISCFLLVTAVGVYYASQQKPTYVASSYIMVDLADRRFSSQRPAIPADALFGSNNRTLTDELFILHNSADLAMRVAARLVEMKQASERPLPFSILRGPDGSALTVEQVSARLGSYVTFGPATGSTSIIRVGALSDQAAEAVVLANLYAQEYVEITKEAGGTHSSTSRARLEEQLAQRQAELQAAEAQLAAYKQRTGTVGLGDEASYLVTRVVEMEAQRDEARAELQIQQAALQDIQRSLEEISPQIVQQMASGLDQRIKALQDQIVTLEMEKDNLQREYPDPAQRSERAQARMNQYDRRLQELRAEVGSLSQQYVQTSIDLGGKDLSFAVSLRGQEMERRLAINSLQTRIQMLDNRLVQAQGQLLGIPQQSMQLAQLERARQYAEQMHQIVSQQLMDAGMRSESRTTPGYARVLREAGFAASSGMERGRSIVLAALLGLFLGLGLAFFRNQLDNRIYKPEQLRKAGYFDIGVIPNMQQLIKEDYQGQPYFESHGQKLATLLVTLSNPMSAVSEAYRRVCTSIQFSVPEGSLKTILVTSPGASEGKSATAANLAIIMAQAGNRTLLLDTDLRRPKVNDLFGLPLSPGFVQTFFNGSETNLETYRTAVDNLYVIPAGEMPDLQPASENGNGKQVFALNPSELFRAKRMQKLLAQFRQHFDVIIIDTPPVLAATDAKLIAAHCDTVVVVVRAGQTREGELEYAVDEIESSGVHVAGVMLNGFDVSMAIGYKYKYQHYSRYGWYSKYGYNGYVDKKSRRSKKEKALSA